MVLFKETIDAPVAAFSSQLEGQCGIYMDSDFILTSPKQLGPSVEKG